MPHIDAAEAGSPTVAPRPPAPGLFLRPTWVLMTVVRLETRIGSMFHPCEDDVNRRGVERSLNDTPFHGELLQQYAVIEPHALTGIDSSYSSGKIGAPYFSKQSNDCISTTFCEFDWTYTPICSLKTSYRIKTSFTNEAMRDGALRDSFWMITLVWRKRWMVHR